MNTRKRILTCIGLGLTAGGVLMNLLFLGGWARTANRARFLAWFESKEANARLDPFLAADFVARFPIPARGSETHELRLQREVVPLPDGGGIARYVRYVYPNGTMAERAVTLEEIRAWPATSADLWTAWGITCVGVCLALLGCRMTQGQDQGEGKLP